jgi:hypothetical protein
LEKSFLVTINTWTTKIHDAIDRSVRTNHLVVDVLRAISRVALAIYTRKRRLSRINASIFSSRGSECKRYAVSLSSQCDECTHISHSFRRAEVNASDVQCHSARIASVCTHISHSFCRAEVNANAALRKGPFEVRNALPRISIGNGT